MRHGVAADTEKFGQPEINLGVLPGADGTQRLTRAVVKLRAMDMILTARMTDAAEPKRANLLSRVFPADQLIPEALKVAEEIALLSPVAVSMAKQAVTRAFETTLVEGVRYERALFLSLFGTPDQREGMTAFVEKRKPVSWSRVWRGFTPPGAPRHHQHTARYNRDAGSARPARRSRPATPSAVAHRHLSSETRCQARMRGTCRPDGRR